MDVIGGYPLQGASSVKTGGDSPPVAETVYTALAASYCARQR
jgi:hypothetical protein